MPYNIASGAFRKCSTKVTYLTLVVSCTVLVQLCVLETVAGDCVSDACMYYLSFVTVTVTVFIAREGPAPSLPVRLKP